MEQLNLSWFAAINAGAHLHGIALWLAIFAAKFSLYFVLLGLAGLWFWGTPKQRETLILAFSGCLFALLLNWIIGLVWFHPRPFVLSLGHTYLNHAPDSSFPSDHATGLCTISFIFLWREHMRGLVGFLLLAISFCMAWARIYLGLHFPLDIMGSIIVSLVATFVTMYFCPFSYLITSIKVGWAKRSVPTRK